MLRIEWKPAARVVVIYRVVKKVRSLKFYESSMLHKDGHHEDSDHFQS